MLRDEEKEYIDTLLEDLNKSIQHFACKNDDFLSMCARSNFHQDSTQQNAENLTIQDALKYVVTQKQPEKKEIPIDGESIFEKQLQCSNLIKKLETELNDLTNNYAFSVHLCDALKSASHEIDESQDISISKIKNDFIQNKKLLREITMKIFSFKTEQFLFLIDELMQKYLNNDGDYLNINNLSISKEVIDFLLNINLVEVHETDSNKIKLCDLY